MGSAESLYPITMEPGTGPQLEGASTAGSTDESKETSRKVEEQAKEMDMATPQPIDETPNYPDTTDRPEAVKEVEAKKVNKRQLSEQQTASLAKAREALAKKRKLAKQSTPEGSDTPTPEPFIQVFKDEFTRFGSQFMQDLHRRLDDLEKRIPYESPLQSNQVKANTTPTTPMPAPSANSTYIERRPETQHFPSDYDTGSYQPAPQVGDLEQIHKYRRRNDAAMNEVFFNNPTMEKRGQNNPDMGKRPTETGSILW